MILQSSPFSSSTYDSLDGSNIPKICEYVRRYEELNRELNQARRHLRELQENSPPSNEQILKSMEAALGTVGAEQTDREAFASVVEQFADSFSRVGAGRQFTQQKATPALQQLFVQ